MARVETPLTETTTSLLRALAPAPATVENLAATLGVTPNAIRHQLTRLERDGLVGREGTVRGPRRPSQLYGLTGAGVDALSRAYLPCLLELLTVLDTRLPGATLRRIMTETGRRLAGDAPPAGSLRDRATRGRKALESLGGIVTEKQARGGIRLEGATCPLGAAALRSRTTCNAVAGLLNQVTGLQATVACDLESAPRPKCGFLLGRNDGQD